MSQSNSASRPGPSAMIWSKHAWLSRTSRAVSMPRQRGKKRLTFAMPSLRSSTAPR